LEERSIYNIVGNFFGVRDDKLGKSLGNDLVCGNIQDSWKQAWNDIELVLEKPLPYFLE